MTGIYLITNKSNGKIYIGSSIDCVDRWYKHKYDLRNKRQGRENSALIDDWHKYGEDAFDFKIIAKCKPDEMFEVERKWTEYYEKEVGKERLYNYYHFKEGRKK